MFVHCSSVAGSAGLMGVWPLGSCCAHTVQILKHVDLYLDGLAYPAVISIAVASA